MHPESYPVVERMAKDLKQAIPDLLQNKELIDAIDINRYKTETIGLETLTDILQELEKPGRDPRGTSKVLEFDPSIRTINDLKEGMVLPGIVTNITNFGCLWMWESKKGWCIFRSWPISLYLTRLMWFRFTSMST